MGLVNLNLLLNFRELVLVGLIVIAQITMTKLRDLRKVEKVKASSATHLGLKYTALVQIVMTLQI